MITMVERMPGRVICQVCCMRLAPSTIAASYREGSMLVSAHRYTMALQPVPCQMDETI